MPIVLFTVTYDLFATDSGPLVADGLVALVGDVTFTPQVDDRPIHAPTYKPRPAGFMLRSQTGWIDKDGQLKNVRGGTVGVRLPADDPVLLLDRLVYRVDFDLRTPTGTVVRVDPTYFDAPTTDRVVSLVTAGRPQSRADE